MSLELNVSIGHGRISAFGVLANDELDLPPSLHRQGGGWEGQFFFEG